ncbi:hypothetical protein B0J13DRAFT_105264 [Dactylonectria estremocensis]|uniref:Uncharacterized protein n=1 Tax=Dactylonectria estremocensis TaxID=1079267 RepID=A0A9P9E5W4_9HYPO|nr:hypothetical protein B0J13DRAFT_105264 [Dactylonectria estremocensis]
MTANSQSQSHREPSHFTQHHGISLDIIASSASALGRSHMPFSTVVKMAFFRTSWVIRPSVCPPLRGLYRTPAGTVQYPCMACTGHAHPCALGPFSSAVGDSSPGPTLGRNGHLQADVGCTFYGACRCLAGPLAVMALPSTSCGDEAPPTMLLKVCSTATSDVHMNCLCPCVSKILHTYDAYFLDPRYLQPCSNSVLPWRDIRKQQKKTEPSWLCGGFAAPQHS